MSDNDKETSDKLDERLATAVRRLVARSRDSAASYRKAAEETKDDFLQPEFERMADERDRLAETLDGIAKELGIQLTGNGAAINDVHRAFLGLKVKLFGSDPRAILSEVARGESAFARVFDGVLGFRMPRAMRRKLQAQHRAVKMASDHYRSLARRVQRQGAASSGRMVRVGSTVRQHPLATVGVIAASALVLGTVAALSSHDKPRWSLDTKKLRSFEKRLRRLEDRGRRQIEDYRPHDLEKRARRGLEKITRHLGGHR